MKSSLVSPIGAGRRATPPSRLATRRAARPRTVWRLRGARSSREEAERGRERPKCRGRARATMWRRRDDRSAVSVTATVVRRGRAGGAFPAALAAGILDLSFFFPSISPSLYLASLRLCGGLSNSPQGRRRRWRRFLARDVKKDDCQKRTRTKRATLRFCERKRDQFRLGRWDRPQFHEQARGRPLRALRFEVSRKIIPILGRCEKRRRRGGVCLNAASLRGSAINCALSSALIMNFV